MLSLLVAALAVESTQWAPADAVRETTYEITSGLMYFASPQRAALSRHRFAANLPCRPSANCRGGFAFRFELESTLRLTYGAAADTPVVNAYERLVSPNPVGLAAPMGQRHAARFGWGGANSRYAFFAVFGVLVANPARQWRAGWEAGATGHYNLRIAELAGDAFLAGLGDVGSTDLRLSLRRRLGAWTFAAGVRSIIFSPLVRVGDGEFDLDFARAIERFVAPEVAVSRHF